METQGRPSIRFILNGHRYELVREDVEQRLADVAPDAIRKHSVRANDIWFPVIQAFEVAAGIPRSEFMSNTARRHLAALGYEVAGEVEPRAGLPAARAAFTPAGVPSRDLEAPAELSEEWHTEAKVQASLVTALAAGGWRILSVANTATKARGIDVIASRDAQPVGVEVKGFPSRRYADPARANEAKRTSPSTQAGHWYAQAALAPMRLRGKEPTWRRRRRRRRRQGSAVDAGDRGPGERRADVRRTEPPVRRLRTASGAPRGQTASRARCRVTQKVG